MPSDPRVSPALLALAGPIASYRSVVVGAAERVRSLLSTAGGAERARLELGAFGSSRIDASRFAELSRGEALDAVSRARLGRAASVLDGIVSASDESLFHADVPPGGSAYVAVEAALARLGRGFGAAAVVELVRTGRYDAERHDRLAESYPFSWWTRADRAHAPPLVLSVDGADLHASALAELLDGAQRLVLLVRGACAPAPLVRLITPGTFVAQSADLASLAPAVAWQGPSIVAVLDEAADVAHYVHDPAIGRSYWQRLTIARRPGGEPRRTIGRSSARQQREELLQLQALAEQPAFPATPVDALVTPGADPAGRLAAWLLAESGLVDASADDGTRS